MIYVQWSPEVEVERQPKSSIRLESRGAIAASRSNQTLAPDEDLLVAPS